MKLPKIKLHPVTIVALIVLAGALLKVFLEGFSESLLLIGPLLPAILAGYITLYLYLEADEVRLLKKQLEEK